MLQKGLFIVPDATLDPRFADYSNVTGDPYIRFYAGRPLFALNGDALGAFCIIDTVPHSLSEIEMQTLRDLGTWVEQEINSEQISRAFLAQRESEARIHAVMESASEAMLLISESHEYLMVNKRFSEFFSLSKEQVLNGETSIITSLLNHIFAKPEQVEALTNDMLANRQKQYSTFLVQQWPEQRDLELFSTPVFYDDGKYLGRLFVYRDVTHRTETERRTNEFVSHVSHELRTPLTAIKGYVDLFVDNNIGPLTTLQHNLLKIIQSNTDRLITLVNDMLDISRIDAGQIELRRKIVDVCPIVDDVVMLLQPQFDAKHQTLTLTCTKSLPSVMGDTDRLTQVFTNLLNNAHQYTPEGGHITILLQGDENFVSIAIHDTGIGLSSEEQANLFTRFFRAQNETAQHVAGTGLGLAITRSIVELHQGKIGVASTLGQGSTFTVHLPTANYIKKIQAIKQVVGMTNDFCSH